MKTIKNYLIAVLFGIAFMLPQSSFAKNPEQSTHQEAISQQDGTQNNPTEDQNPSDTSSRKKPNENLLKNFNPKAEREARERREFITLWAASALVGVGGLTLVAKSSNAFVRVGGAMLCVTAGIAAGAGTFLLMFIQALQRR